MRKKILALFFAFVFVLTPSLFSPLPTSAQQVSRQGVIRKSVTTISSAQILALNSTPITLVPAPGAGQVIVPIAAYVVYTFVTTPYVSASQSLLVEYGASAGNNAFNSLAFQAVLQAGTSRQVVLGVTTGVAITAANSLNKTITARLSVSNPTAGDGTLTIIVYYDIAQNS